VLVPIGSTADRSNTPVSKFVRITVAPHKSKLGEEEIVGKFDYDYADGFNPTSSNHAVSSHTRQSFLSKINFKSIVKTTVWGAVVGATLKKIYNSKYSV
jgi:hypothetical protein